MSKTIYTVSLNDYDSIKEPSVITDGWDYVYYTNNKNVRSNTWKVVYIDTYSSKEARRLKIFNPYRNCDVSIWIDASMQINCNLDEFVNLHCKRDFNLMNHPFRNCVYVEAEECIKRKKDNRDIINAQMEWYKQLGYPENNGMVATGILVRKRSIPNNVFCEQWLSEVNRYSIRDQLSFNFVQWKFPIPYHLFPFEVLKKEFILNKHNK